MRTVMSAGRKREFLGHHLRQHGADAGADVLHARQHLDRAVAQHAHLAGRVGLHVGAPHRLRHADAALDRAGIGAGRMAALPADARGAEAPLLAPDRARVDAVAQGQRIEAEPVGEFVDRLLHGEGARRVTGTAHRPAATGVDEHVVLRDREIGAGVERLREIADAGARPHAGGAVFQQTIAVSVPSRRAPMRRRCQVAGRLPVSSCSSAGRGPGAPAPPPDATIDGDAPIGAERGFGAEAAAHRRDLHAHLAELAGRTPRASSRRTPAVNWVDIQTVSPSARQSATIACGSMQQWVCTWVRYSPSTVTSAAAKPARDVAAAALPRRAAHVARHAAGRGRRRFRPRCQRRRARPDRPAARSAAARCRGRRRRAAARSRPGSGAAPRPPPPGSSPRPPRPARPRSAGSSATAAGADHEHGAHAGMTRRGSGVDRAHPCMRQRRAQDAPLQHARAARRPR